MHDAPAITRCCYLGDHPVKTAVEELSPTRVKLTVEVPFEELEPSLKAAYKKVAQQVRVPGFRPGKVPARIIEQRFGRAGRARGDSQRRAARPLRPRRRRSRSLPREPARDRGHSRSTTASRSSSPPRSTSVPPSTCPPTRAPRSPSTRPPSPTPTSTPSSTRCASGSPRWPASTARPPRATTS